MLRVLLRFRRRLNPEIAIGFLIATVFWAAILGWQAAYAPTEMEKQKCYEVARHDGHKSEECKSFWEKATTDPVAFFTFWLVLSTIGLGVSTVLLWRAGEKQFRHARRSAITQARDMQASVEIARRSYISQHRTWLKVYPVEIGPINVTDGKIRISILIEAENAGNFPAFDVQIGCTPYRARGTVVGKTGIQRLLAQLLQWTQLPNFPHGQTLLPGDKTRVHFTADAETDSAAEALTAGREADGVASIHLTVQLSAVYCVIYKSMASDDWLHSAHSVWIGKKDRSEWLATPGEVATGDIKGTVFSPDNDIT